MVLPIISDRMLASALVHRSLLKQLLKQGLLLISGELSALLSLQLENPQEDPHGDATLHILVCSLHSSVIHVLVHRRFVGR